MLHRRAAQRDRRSMVERPTASKLVNVSLFYKGESDGLLDIHHSLGPSSHRHEVDAVAVALAVRKVVSKVRSSHADSFSIR